MNILVCFEGRIRPDSTGFYLLTALRSLGHGVTHITPDQIMRVEGGYDLYIKCDDGLRNSGWNPALHPSAYVVIDTHIEWDWRVKTAEDGKFDLVTVAQSEGLKLPWKNKKVIYNPLGCDQTIHYRGPQEKKYDGCFIGNFHNGLAGPRIDALDSFFKCCDNFFYGQRGPDKFPEIYAQSKIVFNRSINGDLNMRVFEALCSGSCLLTDRVEDMDKVGLIDGIHYVGYTDSESLQKSAKMLLADDDKREYIAAAGRAVSFSHTYAKRMEKLIEELDLNAKENTNGYAVR